VLMLFVGRYTVYRGMTSATAASLAAGDPLVLYRQQALWTAKKAVKATAPLVWDAVRKHVFKS
jgi:hypothetical protein